MFVNTFIKRPILASVCSLVIILAGLIAIPTMPVAQFPPLAPPNISVTAVYTGANAQEVETAVTTPLDTVGSHRFRPKADFGFDNFFLASDYVRTYTDLATMEGANEAARRAVNALLERDGSSAPRAQVWPLEQPWYVRPWQALDAWRFSHGKPNLFSTPEMRRQPGDKPEPPEPPQPPSPKVQAKGRGA